jgi:hypothetical protein
VNRPVGEVSPVASQERKESPGPAWLVDHLAELEAAEGDVVDVRIEGRTQIVYLCIEVKQVIRTDE